MKKFRTRSELRDLVIQSFARETEITAIYLFGKEVTEETDEHSDIDMVICSNDLAATQSKYQRIFNEISPIMGTFLLNSAENDLSQMVMLKGFSPYQKIDFTITDQIETKALAGFGPFVSVYKDDSPAGEANSKLDVIKPEQVKNQLDNFLFSVPRFTKCLFRNDYDMYRRWKNISDSTMVLLYEKHFGWEEKTSKQSIPVKEIAKLNHTITDDEEERLTQIFPSSGIVNVAESYKACIEFSISLCKQKADYFGVELNENLIQHMERFMDVEITRYIKIIG